MISGKNICTPFILWALFRIIFFIALYYINSYISVGVANELHRAPPEFQLSDIQDLNSRLCELRIGATASVLSRHGANVPQHAIAQTSADEVFAMEEQLLLYRSDPDEYAPIRGILSLARGGSAVTSATDPFSSVTAGPSRRSLDHPGGSSHGHSASRRADNVDQG